MTEYSTKKTKLPVDTTSGCFLFKLTKLFHLMSHENKSNNFEIFLRNHQKMFSFVVKLFVFSLPWAILASIGNISLQTYVKHNFPRKACFYRALQ